MNMSLRTVLIGAFAIATSICFTLGVLAALEMRSAPSIALWGAVALALGVAAGLLVCDRISRRVVERSRQIGSAAKELSVIVIGSEVASDHAARTLQTVKRAGGLIVELAEDEAGSCGGGVATMTQTCRTVESLASLHGEIQDDAVVMYTLAREMYVRMRDAEAQLAALNDAAKGLREFANSPA